MTRLFPFEQAILHGVGAALPDTERKKFSDQIAHVNKVQRLLAWNEIEFYCVRWFKASWPSAILFDNLSEFELGSGTLRTSSAVAEVKVWSVDGHVFSIESATSLILFRDSTNASFALAPAVHPVGASSRAE